MQRNLDAPSLDGIDLVAIPKYQDVKPVNLYLLPHTFNAPSYVREKLGIDKKDYAAQ